MFSSFSANSFAVIGLLCFVALAGGLSMEGAIEAKTGRGLTVGPTPTPTSCSTPGSLDTSFDGDGKVITPIGTANEIATGVAFQSDGKMVVAGSTYSEVNSWDFAVVRYNADGSLDTTFDSDGKVVTPLTPGAADNAFAVAIQSDGRIVVVGQTYTHPFDYDAAVVRYNTDGSLDTSFDGDGIVITPYGGGDDGARAVVIQPDGRIVVAGGDFDNTFTLARYNSNGTLDTSFDGDGLVFTPVGNFSDGAYALAIQSDGRIVAAGNTVEESFIGDFAVVRYNPNGSLDTSFGDGGIAITSIGEEDAPYSMAIQSDNRILVAGRSFSNGFLDGAAVVRYEPNGTLDKLFGDHGKIFRRDVGYILSGVPIAIQPDGRIVTATSVSNGSDYDFGVIRFKGDGSPDTSFDGDGKVLTPLVNDDIIKAAAIQPDGRIVTVGATGPNYDIAVVRYNAAPCPMAASISGTVTYGNAAAPPQYISNVTVTGIGSTNVSTLTAPPGANAGEYTLNGFGAGAYTVSLSKTTGQNSVTSNDAALIAQHVAGLNPITSTNKKIAADASANGTISSNDAALIARFVAGLTSQTGDTNQWKFFVPDPTFPIGSSPMTRTYSSVTSDLAGQDYIGLLIGDVSGNWTNSGAKPSGSRKLETDGSISVSLPLVVSDGREIIVPVNIQGAAGKGIISYEFDLRYDPDVIQPQADAADLKETVSRGLSVVTNARERGRLRVVVYGAYPIENNGVLLNLRFTTVGATASASKLTLERIMFNEGEPQASVANGEVKFY